MGDGSQRKLGRIWPSQVCSRMNQREGDGHERWIIGVMWQRARVFRAATNFKPAKRSSSIPHLRLNQAGGEHGSVKTDSHMLDQNSSMPT